MTTTSNEQQALTAVDRCDRCGAQAFVMILTATALPLLFCGHHDKEHRAALLAKGATVVIDQAVTS